MRRRGRGGAASVLPPCATCDSCESHTAGCRPHPRGLVVICRRGEMSPVLGQGVAKQSPRSSWKSPDQHFPHRTLPYKKAASANIITITDYRYYPIAVILFKFLSQPDNSVRGEGWQHASTQILSPSSRPPSSASGKSGPAQLLLTSRVPWFTLR